MSVEEAKRRLRQASEQAGPAAWVRRRPWTAVVTGLAVGFVIGRERDTVVHLAAIVRQALPLLVSRWLVRRFPIDPGPSAR